MRVGGVRGPTHVQSLEQWAAADQLQQPGADRSSSLEKALAANAAVVDRIVGQPARPDQSLAAADEALEQEVTDEIEREAPWFRDFRAQVGRLDFREDVLRTIAVKCVVVDTHAGEAA